MLYIKEELCLHEKFVLLHLEMLNEWNEVNPSVLMMIHYVYHQNDEDFDGGLKLLDLLYKKLSKYFELAWDIETIKNNIRTSEFPGHDYLEILNQLLTTEMIAIYGI